MNPPGWAEALIDLVMAHEGILTPPDLTWNSPASHAGAAFASEGVTCGNSIVVDPGLSIRDARHTLTHELAHWATSIGHCEVMYAKLYELLWLYGEPGDTDYARLREAEYRPVDSELGWQRFVTRITFWASRIQDYVELLAQPDRSLIGC